jgi:NAD(P)-dependent dehydrogenase (short-subunit alcohol dehydrogenase family)
VSAAPDPADLDAVPDFRDLARMDGRTVLVLCGGAGIGRQTSHALAQLGAIVVCVDSDGDRAERVAKEIGGVALSADVTDRAAFEDLLAESARLAGPVRGVVDIVGAATIGPLADLDDAGWQRLVDVNLRHAFLTAQLAGPLIAENGGGAMVFVGSISGLRSVPQQALYGALKAAVHHLVVTQAHELAGRGVRVNAVAPGWTRTPRLHERLGPEKWAVVDDTVPRGSAAVPWEIAGPIAFLMSPLAGYVTGQVLAADGGLTAAAPHPDVFPGAAR